VLGSRPLGVGTECQLEIKCFWDVSETLLQIHGNRRFEEVFSMWWVQTHKKSANPKKPNPLVFWVLLGFGLYWVFRIFLFERAVWKLVGWFSSSAKLLFRFVSTSHLKICKITYWLLESFKHKEIFIIFTCMTNGNWISLMQVFCWVFQWVFTRVSEPCFWILQCFALPLLFGWREGHPACKRVLLGTGLTWTNLQLKLQLQCGYLVPPYTRNRTGRH